MACSSCSKSVGLSAVVAGLSRMSCARRYVMTSSSIVHDMFMSRRLERLVAEADVELDRELKEEAAVEPEEDEDEAVVGAAEEESADEDGNFRSTALCCLAVRALKSRSEPQAVSIPARRVACCSGADKPPQATTAPTLEKSTARGCW